jgi:hypothetical protein
VCLRRASTSDADTWGWPTRPPMLRPARFAMPRNTKTDTPSRLAAALSDRYSPSATGKGSDGGDKSLRTGTNPHGCSVEVYWLERMGVGVVGAFRPDGRPTQATQFLHDLLLQRVRHLHHPVDRARPRTLRRFRRASGPTPRGSRRRWPSRSPRSPAWPWRWR